MRKPFTLIVILAFAAIACNKKPEAPDYSHCTFAYDAATAKVQWTAYKFTERLGVNGSFNTVMLENTHEGRDAAAVFQGSTFSVDAFTVNSGNPDRDAKINKAFFSALKNKGNITGTIDAVGVGDGKISLTLNGVTKSIPVTVEQSQLPALTVRFPLNLKDFNALGPLAALNKICIDLHKGKDGKSVLWPDISVTITAQLSPKCPV